MGPLTPRPRFAGFGWPGRKALDVRRVCPFMSPETGLRTFPTSSFKYRGGPQCPASTPHPHSLQQSPQSPERLGPLLQGGHSTHVYTHAHTHACTRMLISDSHQTPEAEGCHRTLLSTPALDTCELPLQARPSFEGDTPP